MTTTQEQIEEQVENNLQKIRAPLMEAMKNTPPSEVLNATSNRIRLNKMWRLGEEVSKIISPNTACKNGCSHCCKQAVTISEEEAKRIAEYRQSGYYKVAENTPEAFIKKIEEQRDTYRGEECPFLENNLCTIYSVRPIACRFHFNLTDESSLCDTQTTNEVPNINFNQVHMLQIRALSPEEMSYGDIREYFGRGVRSKETKQKQEGTQNETPTTAKELTE